MADDLGAFARRLDALAADLGRAAEESLKELGKAAEDDAREAVRGDLGDLSMSHWWTGRPIDITAKAEVQGDGVLIRPGRKERSPWRVLQDGRQASKAGDRRNSGTYTRKRDGAVVQKTRKVKRSSGATGGRGTWTTAVGLMAERTPKREHRVVQSVLRKHLKGG